MRSERKKRRLHCLDLSVEAKLVALLDHVASLKTNKGFKNMRLERRQPIAIRRESLLPSVIKAFLNIRGPSIYRSTDVKFVGEAGMDRGGLTTEVSAAWGEASRGVGWGAMLSTGVWCYPVSGGVDAGRAPTTPRPATTPL